MHSLTNGFQARHTTAVSRSTRPVISHAETIELAKLIKIHPIDVGLYKTITGRRASVREEHKIRTAEERGQKHFLVVELPEEPEALTKAVELLHKIRRKEPPSEAKIKGLSEKGYMLVHEPEAMASLQLIMPSAFVNAGPSIRM